MPVKLRLHTIDATRGVLALIVVASHVGRSVLLDRAADIAVAMFFVMSGYVLALGYDGQFWRFQARRQVRLWPVYAVCIGAAYAVRGQVVPMRDLIWWPVTLDPHAMADGPAWSLYAEVWATPVLPVLFWLARRGQIAAVTMVAVTAGLMRMFPWVFPVLFMAAGVAASTFPLRLPQDVPAPLLWLGRVSYSLYLSHAVVLAALGPLGVVLVLPVAWALWWAVERPSILWSRRVGPALLPARAKA